MLTMIIISGNFITLVALAKNKPLRRKENVLIASLAVADLLVGVLTFMNTLLVYLKVIRAGWTPLTMIGITVIIVSLVHMVFIGVNRFIAVVIPLRYSALVTKRTVLVMVVLVWLIPVAMMVPLQVYATGQDRLPSGVAYADWAHALVGVIWVLLLFVALVILYGKVMMETRAQALKVQAWQQKQPAPNSDSTGRTRSQKTDRSKKSTRLVLIILLMAMILNAPYFVYSLLIVIGTPIVTVPMATLVLFAQQCYLTNSGINIFIYALFTSDFRKAYQQMFCAKCRQKRNHVEDVTSRVDTNVTNVTDQA